MQYYNTIVYIEISGHFNYTIKSIFQFLSVPSTTTREYDRKILLILPEVDG